MGACADFNNKDWQVQVQVPDLGFNLWTEPRMLRFYKWEANNMAQTFNVHKPYLKYMGFNELNIWWIDRSNFAKKMC